MKLISQFFFKNTFLLVLVLILLKTSNVKSNDIQKWCWTKSQVNNPGFVLNQKKGGFNWGYCMNEEESQRTTVSYSAFVRTALTPRSTTSSQIKVKLCGTKGCFPNYTNLSTSGFDKQGIRQAVPEFENIDVGDPLKLKIRLEGTEPYLCTNIFLIKDGVETNFECLKKLYPCSQDPNMCEIESIADGSVTYNISIKTGDDKSDGNLGPVHMIIYGEKRISMEKIFTDKPLTYGSIVNSIIQTEDLGEIKGFKLILQGEGKWRPVVVTIKPENSDEKIYQIDNVILKYPGNNIYDVKEKINVISSSEDDSSGSTEQDNNSFPSMGGSTSSPSIPGVRPPATHSLDVNDVNGGLIAYEEKKKIINLKCDQVLKNTEFNLFGPDYPTKNVEYMSVLVRCPSNCSELNTTVFGVGIHPTDSPICMSAIVDNAMSPYGGIVNISIVSGLDQYKIPDKFPRKIGNITIKAYLSTDSMKSYTLSKVDGVDLVEKDYRILDSEGKLSNLGRLEIRLGGEWGSVCMMGVDEFSANIVCKDLGYKGGKWESKNDMPNVCGRINGKNFCGSSLTKIHFSNINCGLTDNTFDKCNKNFADRLKCDHTKDAVINCFNQNFENSDQIPEKTVRLDATKILEETSEIIGRLELAKQNKYLPVCSTKFNLSSAKIACRAMGYSDGEQVLGDEAKEYQNSPEANIGFSASEVECDEQSGNLNQCKGIFDGISCTHDFDTVIKCKGTGDQTGKSQYEIKPLSPPPELSKLGLIKLDVTCNKKGQDMDLRGDPGSIFKICCPQGCEKQPGTVWGIGLFSGDSNICLAAIHTGVLEKRSSGCFTFTRAHGNSSYASLISNNLESLRSDLKWVTAFHLSKLNSGWENMAIKFKRDDPIAASSFIETEIENDFEEVESEDYYRNLNKLTFFKNSVDYYENLKPTKQNQFQFSSFLELRETLPKPLFSFVESNPKHIFSTNDNLVFESGKLTKINDFTLFFRFNMKQFTTTSVIFSYKGSDGFNLFVNQNSELILGSMTDSKFQSFLDVKVPLNAEVKGFVVYKAGQLSTSILVQNTNGRASHGVSASFDIPNMGRVGIGRLAGENKLQFTGTIDYVEIYSLALDFSNIPSLLNEIKQRKNSNQLKKEYTVDQRKCVSPCMSTVPETGNPPKEAVLNAGLSIDIETPVATEDDPDKPQEVLVVDGVANPETPIDENKDKNTPGGVLSPTNFTQPPFPGELPLNSKTLAGTVNTAPFTAEEDTTLDDDKFRNVRVPKTFFRLSCPKMDSHAYFPVYGSAIYRSDSSICRAALHLGKLKPGIAKDIIVRVDGTHEAYNGSMGYYDIQTEDILETDKHLSFTVEEADNLKVITCDEDLRSPNFLNQGLSKIIVVQCPKDCDKVNGDIFGGNTTDEKCAQAKDNSAANCVYSEDSQICKAAIHCGVLNSMGGYIEVKIEGEQPKFIGLNSFGVISKEKSSQVRSYSFAGQRTAIYANYQENYEGSILQNWSIHVAPSAKHRLTNSWTFYENNTNFYNAENQKEKIRAILHKGQIQTEMPFTSSTILKKKDTEFANGLVKFNLMIYEIEPVYVYLRFIDEENHIALLINNRDNMNNYTLIIKVQGSLKIIDTKNMPMELKKWYRYEAYLYSDSVRILVQEDKVRSHKELFNKKITQISRGGLAFGTNGNKLFYISGISIEPFSLKATKRTQESSTYTFDYVLKKSANEKEVNRWCKKTFKYSADEYQRCLIPQFYCRHRCQERLPADEYGVLNYKCVNECVTSMKKSSDSQDLTTRKENLKQFNTDDKVDFLVKGNPSYQSATVKSANFKGDTQYVTVEFEDNLGNSSIDEVKADSDRIQKCGFKLKKRTDCGGKK